MIVILAAGGALLVAVPLWTVRVLSRHMGIWRPEPERPVVLVASRAISGPKVIQGEVLAAEPGQIIPLTLDRVSQPR